MGAGIGDVEVARAVAGELPAAFQAVGSRHGREPHDQDEQAGPTSLQPHVAPTFTDRQASATRALAQSAAAGISTTLTTPTLLITLSSRNLYNVAESPAVPLSLLAVLTFMGPPTHSVVSY